MTPKPAETKLRITSCSSVYTGKHPNGHSYTIYEIEAVRPDGTVVAESLRSFEELPVGEVLDLNVVKFDSPEHGTSYTLSRRGGSGNAKKIRDLEETVRALVARLEALEQVVGAIGDRVLVEGVSDGASPDPAVRS